ncbi:insulin-like growth factor-binding protein complex acid labile subunit [Bactrocera tryoni]|uniref:insulin-like growth factor-binding protein complex acid labile subunit n=1 Tax=Bactrocera tryoni TaxID=59916 RepID=UPI001A96C03D|nr:insulin-like growth factor-binding protein complex acid labile subunit [Bactrocera tryoni]XP_039957179.1 insulin-like growth factor-binding protein complex acid labile subunit [Bactrocera tryoni]XP_039957180.1 insulin-like growth factor-binding protein complex acid labile subunit [Bactrocera tryoni]
MSRARCYLTITLLLFLASTASALNCPANCKCFWVLDSLCVECAHKGLTEYPNFSDLPIDHLDLSGNNFDHFPTQFAAIESLVYLDLSNNNISQLDADALIGFTALRVLLLANNNFNSWTDLNPTEAFRNAISLKHLSLSGNNLETFTDFKAEQTLISDSLTNLELEHCSISTVGGDHLINGLPALERLSLSGNSLTTLNNIPSGSLRGLELSNCSLLRIPTTLIEGLPNLEKLNVSRNFAMELKDVIISETLLELDASFCSLDTINLSGFPSLAHAYLRGNMLRILDQNTFANNTQLQTLDLAKNSLRNIQTNAFVKLTHLATLDLSYNEIALLDKNLFRSNDVLVSVNLSHNVMEKFTKLISNSLREINLSGCEIIMIDANAFTGLSVIQRLDLSKTLIKEFPSNMHSETLQRLDLSNCKLSSIRNATFSGFPELAWLYLSGNRFTNPIPTDYFRSNHYLDAIWISDNPWVCNCHDPTFIDFYDFLTAVPPKLKDRNYVRCASPSYLYGKTWEAACGSVWIPNGRSSKVEKAWTVIMLCFLGICVGTLLYTGFRRFIKSRRQRRNREEYRQNRDEMMEIRAQNQRMLEEPATPNAPNFFQNNLPSYEDAIRMPKLERPAKSMVDLTETGHTRRNKLRRSQTNPDGDIEDADLLLDDRQRFRSEEMLSNRVKERTANITPFARTGYVAYSNSRSRRLSVEGARFPAAHLKSQNLQSAEKIANFQGFEHSPYTKRRPKVAEIPPFKRATMRTDSVEFLTDPEFDDHSKPGSPFARRKPKTPTTSADVGTALADSPLAPAVEDYFGKVPKPRDSTSDDSDFQVVVDAENSSLVELHNTSSSGGGNSATNLERGRRKKRLNSTNRRASGNFTAAAAAAGESSSTSSDRDPIVVVHKPMRETLF